MQYLALWDTVESIFGIGRRNKIIYPQVSYKGINLKPIIPASERKQNINGHGKAPVGKKKKN